MRPRGAARLVARLVAVASAFGLAVQCTTLVGIDKDYQLGVAPDAAPDVVIDVVDDTPITCGDFSSGTNCGRCGHDCLGGACQAGVCQPVVVALGQANPEALAVSATALYWTNIGAGTIATAPLAGGPPSIVVSGQGSPRGIAVAGSELYFTTLLPGQIQHLALPATMATTLVGAQDTPRDIAVDPTHLFWTSNVADGGLWESARDGGAVLELAPGARAYALAIDAAAVYFTTQDGGTPSGTGTIATVARPSGPAQTLVSNVKDPRGIALDASNVYFTSYGDGSVSRIPRTGGTPTVIASSRFQPTAVAVDASFVYWVEEYAGGSVLRMPLAGGPITTLAATQNLPHALALDDRSVYWANYGDGKVMRVAK